MIFLETALAIAFSRKGQSSVVGTGRIIGMEAIVLFQPEGALEVYRREDEKSSSARLLKWA